MVQKPSPIFMLQYTLSGYRASQPHPTPTAGIPPPMYGSIAFTHLEENSSTAKLPYLC
jgi:hypothetical protein